MALMPMSGTQAQIKRMMGKAWGSSQSSKREGGAWRLSFLPWEGPVLVRMQVEMQDIYNAAGSVRDERMS
ncbi:hypothetical protein PF005_g30715 [Phytophthora fragariae]|uniref:Uncharacterized protein n=1 Tax=Phytophthora fragariae TaxID=53985 RepID=A0A6A3VEJ8_9STRA|nr:hypothetical protein PF007_g4616 [Phytophthora fragariae]KAE9162030.1 hypothetical protein PF004_g30625 [Phytophthora fragariae]KAE9162791.1 hypothetical protein PF005_g30715 [Phytophthora fragariae]KAE9164071.1 hypothetical protein PF002_g31694 [Phytophthora fragariae]